MINIKVCEKCEYFKISKKWYKCYKLYFQGDFYDFVKNSLNKRCKYLLEQEILNEKH